MLQKKIHEVPHLVFNVTTKSYMASYVTQKIRRMYNDWDINTIVNMFRDFFSWNTMITYKCKKWKHK